MHTMHLIESAHTRSGGGLSSFLSMSAHAAIVVLALYATMREPLKSEPAADPRVYFVPEIKATPSRPRAASVPTPQRAAVVAAKPAPAVSAPAVAQAAAQPTELPAVDVPLADPSAVASVDPVAAVSDNTGAAPGTPAKSGPYNAFEVEVPASSLSKTGPDYPERAIRLGMSGTVIARFVVGANGRVERDIAILDSTSPEFASSVESFLRRARYSPARVGGRSVRQMVEQRFVFELRR